MNNDFVADISLDDILRLASLKTLDELDSSKMDIILDGTQFNNDIALMTEHNSIEISNQFAKQLQENIIFYAQKDLEKQRNAAKSFRDQL